MPQLLGRLCLVLHGHLPYVLHHGVWPHGQAWLFEAACETYLPLLELLDELAEKAPSTRLTIGLTPVLLEQLANPYFKSGLASYLNERINRARIDAADFGGGHYQHFEMLARHWERFFTARLQHFLRIKQDLVAEFARHFHAGRIEILTSSVMHAYLPLLLKDQSIRAQLRAGAVTSKRHLQMSAAGLWLPECAYRPASDAWVPSVLNDQISPMPRPGLERWIAEAGLSHFFVDTHLVRRATPMGTLEGTTFSGVNEALIFWDTKRGWRDPLEPVGVSSAARPPQTFAFARHPRVSEQVWSSVIGYPGSGEYLEFHRKHGLQGLRYHRVTNHHTPLHDKAPYDPAPIAGKTYEHAQHFCGVVREVLHDYRASTGRLGTIVAPFDAELFGHWWFEGPGFLRDVLLTLSADPSVELVTSQMALNKSVRDKVVSLPEGSWGEGGGHGVWLNDQTRWLWEAEYHAEERFLKLRESLPWRQSSEVRRILQMAGRELLLLQASDWPFVIHSRGAVDYGMARFSGHATRFDRLAGIAEKVAGGGKPDTVELTEIAEAEAHDVLLKEIDLDWWE